MQLETLRREQSPSDQPNFPGLRAAARKIASGIWNIPRALFKPCPECEALGSKCESCINTNEGW